jgi:two-component system response regulator YesN
MYKVLIVEDENLIREGIARVIRASCPRYTQIYEARDGEEALSLAIELAPDLIITDIQMPKLNGIEFIEQLKEENPHVAIIIISGYDDFQYAQRGLKLAVKDYMLKPVESSQLAGKLNLIADELDQLRLYRKNQEELQKIVNESLPLYRERLFRNLIDGGESQEELLRRACQLGLPLNARYYTIALIRFDPAIHKDAHLTDVMVFEMIGEISSRCNFRELELHTFPVKHMELALLIGCNEQTKERSFGSVNEFLTGLGTTLKKHIPDHPFNIAIGSLAEVITDLHKAYQQAEEAMLYRLSMNRLILNYEEIGTPAIPEKQFDKHAEQLLLDLKFLNRESALHHLRLYWEEVASATRAHPHWVKLTLLELIMSVLRVLEENKISLDPFLQNKQFDPYLNIYRLETSHELQEWLEQFIKMCLLEMERGKVNTSVSHVEKAKQFIDTRLSDSELSLRELAANLFLSPNYLRQLFRQETGESYVEYVTRVRMERAVQLLRDSLLKIQDIAEKVGFEEQRYFSSCFKKHYSMTPTEYREALQYGLI